MQSSLYFRLKGLRNIKFRILKAFFADPFALKKKKKKHAYTSTCVKILREYLNYNEMEFQRDAFFLPPIPETKCNLKIMLY